MKKDLSVSELAYYFPKCQPKDITFLFKPCFAYVLTTTRLYSFAYFIYAAHSNSQGEPKIPSFPVNSLNLPTILHGFYPDGSNVMSASQSIAAGNRRITQRGLCWEEKGRRWRGGLTRCKPQGCVTCGCWVYRGYMGPSRQERGWARLHPTVQKTNIAETVAILALTAFVVSWHWTSMLSSKKHDSL